MGIGPYEGAGVRAVEDAGPYEGVQVDDLLTKADNHNNYLDVFDRLMIHVGFKLFFG